MILGFLVPVVYVPGWTGSVIPSAWVLLSCTLPLFLFHWLRVTWSHVFFFLFLMYACWSVSWSSTPTWGIEYVWHLGVLFLCFLVGSRLDKLEPVFRGLGLAMVVNSVLAIAQFFGFDWIPVREAEYGLFISSYKPAAGLFYNPNLLSEAAALVLVGCVIYKRLGLAACCLPALILGNSRVAWLSVVIVLLAHYRMWLSLIGASILGISAMLRLKGLHGVSDRLSLWQSINWSFWGSGPPFLVNGNNHAYNDGLEMASVFGVGSLLFFAILVEFWRSPILQAGAIISLAAFPLETPVAGFILLLVAGHFTRDLPLVRIKCATRGDLLRRRVALEQSIRSCLGKPDLPLQPCHQPRMATLS